MIRNSQVIVFCMMWMFCQLGTVGAGQQKTNKRNFSSTIRGTVLDALSLPLLSKVDLLQIEVQNGRAIFEQRCSVETDQNGSYVCSSLPSGKYILIAHPRNAPVQASSKSGQGPSPTFAFFPGTTDFGSAQPISLQEGDVQSADFNLIPSSLADLSGSVTGHPDQVAFALYVEDAGHSVNTGVPFKYSPQSGTFEAQGLPDGDYELAALWSTKGKSHHSTQELLIHGADISDVTLSDSTDVRVSGQVIVKEAELGLPTQITLYSKDLSVFDLTASVGTDGKFQFPPIPRAVYVVGTTPNHTDDKEYIESIAIDGTARPTATIDERWEESNQSLTVTLSRGAGIIRGSVDTDGGNLSDVLIVVESEDSGLVIASRTNRLGDFDVGGLAPGSYRLYAWVNSQNVEYRNPEFLGRFAKDSREVTLDSGSIADGIRLTPLLINN